MFCNFSAGERSSTLQAAKGCEAVIKDIILKKGDTGQQPNGTLPSFSEAFRGKAHQTELTQPYSSSVIASSISLPTRASSLSWENTH